MPTSPTSLDHDFLDAFIKCGQGDSSALADLERLAKAGATTAAFDDSELGGPNFALIVQDFLERGTAPTEPFLGAAKLVMSRGPAFLTNRMYVGNGGLPAIHFVLGVLADFYPLSPGPHRPSALAFSLLEAMVAHGLDVRPHFWGDFVYLLREQSEPAAEWAESHQRVIQLAEQHGAFTFDDALVGQLLEVEHGGLTKLLNQLLRFSRVDVIRWLAEAIDRSESARALFTSRVASEKLLNVFTSSKLGRSVLHTLAGRFAIVRDWLLRADTLFALVRKKERSTLHWLIHRAPDVVAAARDENGNTLLQALANVRGRTEGIAGLLQSLPGRIAALKATEAKSTT